FVSKSTEMVYNFRKSGIEHLVARVDKLVTSKKYNQMKIIKNPSINIGVKVENNFLELMMNIDQTKRDEFAKILKAYESKESYIQMENGNFLEINEHVEKAIENLKTGLNLTTDMLAQPDLIVGKQQAFYIEYFLKKECRYNVFNDEKFHSILNEITSIEITQEKQPVNLNGTLKKYQLVGYNKLKTMKKHAFGMMLADDMGLGKTIQVIAYLLDQKNNGNTFSFIICPSSLILNWEKEFAKFAPTLNVLSINLDGSKRDAQFQKMHQYDILITSYDLLKRDIANYLELKFDNLIIDEAHYIKNSMTQNYKTVKKINADTRIALTGTPIENRLSELWAIMNFIVPGYLSNYKVFNAQFETPIELYDDRERLELLQKLCFPFILRRMKKDVLLELPNKTEIFIYAKMEEKQENLYYANLVKMKEELRELEITTSKLKILSMLMKLRQLASDPTLVHKEYNGNSAKLEVLMELIDSISEAGAKVLVFSQFTSMLSIVKKKLEQKGISNFLLTGATKKDKRQELVEKFNKDKTTVFLISLKAGGSGLNLTGAENVIHFDPWWNLSTQNQATDRVYRIGQEKNVTVYKLITSNTIEEKIVKMQDKKGKLASSILDGKLEGFSSISEEDLIKLFD
ncbi:MAG: DEAD/DEAH box helicase, partial [Spiroplasma sp.]|nr:DEAD/DEAH box helicase [Mycoplasmatales bacterium]